MATTTNYYEVLGVRREASQAEIRNAYRNLAKTLHPDHPGGSAEKFSRIQEANAVLSDPDRRREPDEAPAPAPPAAHPARAAARRSSPASRRRPRSSPPPTVAANTTRPSPSPTPPTSWPAST